ncbi:RNA 2',3'-cyclic phosphodiesterase [Anaerotignum sp. MB30-C6]|uniref:RNA 2',3'-cyclic phosphodiesterase n=1 Tax=Anaerotignum sp. MB30-C6 TaxID=3070814 RepID=UPI0027DC1CC1|nr:RNA 2',3'-cyclic phosphodiesterase [Anaerotignum sp. MB30-C6]WMI80629.1 RNA 2',3'-cyclic phosphodiesterase [Anaerotignum sp. MB30-C6]
MRTFIAIELSPDIREYLSEVQTETQKYCRRGNYTPQDNFHITLHFLGEINPSDVEYLQEAMFDAAQRNKAFDLKLGQIGFFGRGERGILWAGVEKSDPLQRLFFNLEKSLERQGFAREKKGLSPHITLGREVEPQRGFSDVQKAVVMDGRSFAVEKITLMESVRRGPRLIYKPLYRQLLKGYGNKR